MVDWIFRDIAHWLGRRSPWFGLGFTATLIVGSIIWANGAGSDPPKVQEARRQQRERMRIEREQAAARIASNKPEQQREQAAARIASNKPEQQREQAAARIASNKPEQQS